MQEAGPPREEGLTATHERGGGFRLFLVLITLALGYVAWPFASALLWAVLAAIMFAMFDLTAFCVFDVVGPGALELGVHVGDADVA